jgi:excisionase family DNA binding protein
VEIMTLRETADFLQLHPMTVYRLVKKKRLPAFQVGNRWRMSREALEKMFTMNMEVPSENKRKSRVPRKGRA